MTFIDVRLPTGIERGATRIDEEAIEIEVTDGLWEQRNARHSQSLLEFNINIADGKLATATNIQAIRSMYKVARGKLHTFRFRDWTEYQLVDETIGTGNGSATTFQIKKSWTLDGNTVSRVITRPCDSPAIVVKKNGVVQVSGFSVNYDTGVITFTSAPANGHAIQVTCDFDIPVRFDTDLTSVMRAFTAERLEGIVLVEVRE